jgi:hypothetical protein
MMLLLLFDKASLNDKRHHYTSDSPLKVETVRESRGLRCGSGDGSIVGEPGCQLMTGEDIVTGQYSYEY